MGVNGLKIGSSEPPRREFQARFGHFWSRDVIRQEILLSGSHFALPAWRFGTAVETSAPYLLDSFEGAASSARSGVFHACPPWFCVGLGCLPPFYCRIRLKRFLQKQRVDPPRPLDAEARRGSVPWAPFAGSGHSGRGFGGVSMAESTPPSSGVHVLGRHDLQTSCQGDLLKCTIEPL